MQITSSDDANVHFTFRLRHSQQLCVPFRTFLRFAGLSTKRESIVDERGSCNDLEAPRTVAHLLDDLQAKGCLVRLSRLGFTDPEVPANSAGLHTATDQW